MISLAMINITIAKEYLYHIVYIFKDIGLSIIKISVFTAILEFCQVLLTLRPQFHGKHISGRIVSIKQ